MRGFWDVWRPDRRRDGCARRRRRTICRRLSAFPLLEASRSADREPTECLTRTFRFQGAKMPSTKSGSGSNCPVCSACSARILPFHCGVRHAPATTAMIASYCAAGAQLGASVALVILTQMYVKLSRHMILLRRTPAAMLDTEPFRVAPGSAVDLRELPTRDDGGFGKREGKKAVKRLSKRLVDLQELLYARKARLVAVVYNVGLKRPGSG